MERVNLGGRNRSLFTLLSRAGGDFLSGVQEKGCEPCAVTSSPATGPAQDWAAEAEHLARARKTGVVLGYFQSCLTWFVLLFRASSPLPCSLCSPREHSQCHIT